MQIKPVANITQEIRAPSSLPLLSFNDSLYEKMKNLTFKSLVKVKRINLMNSTKLNYER